MSSPNVSIIILNWNGWKDTIECLESLYRITYPNYDIIVVDNGSKDNSVQKIKEYCKGKIKVESKFFEYDPSNKPIYVLEYTREKAEKGSNFKKEKYFSKLPSNRKLRLILNEKNYGFAEGNNIGIRYALKALNSDYILLLNNDTIVDPSFLTELVKVAESDENAGIVGSKICYYDNPNKIWHRGAKVNIWTGLGCCIEGYYKNDSEYQNPEELKYPSYISGCVMLFKSNIVKKLGGFDNIWFAYYEDADVCFKAQSMGYRCIYVPTSKVWHKVSSSTKDVKGIQLYYFTRNRIIFMLRWAPKLNKIIFVISSITLLPFVLVREIFRGRLKHMRYEIKGFIDGFSYSLE